MFGQSMFGFVFEDNFAFPDSNKLSTLLLISETEKSYLIARRVYCVYSILNENDKNMFTLNCSIGANIELDVNAVSE